MSSSKTIEIAVNDLFVTESFTLTPSKTDGAAWTMTDGSVSGQNLKLTFKLLPNSGGYGTALLTFNMIDDSDDWTFQDDALTVTDDPSSDIAWELQSSTQLQVTVNSNSDNETASIVFNGTYGGCNDVSSEDPTVTIDRIKQRSLSEAETKVEGDLA